MSIALSAGLIPFPLSNLLPTVSWGHRLAASWGHRLAGMESPTGNPLVRGVVEGARRKLARPVQSKQPLSDDVIANITLSLSAASASLADIHLLFILLVGYAGIFRISEILDIRVKYFAFFDDFMKINLLKCKNDQYRDGHVSVIARSHKPTCPVGITEILFVCCLIPKALVTLFFAGLLSLNS